MLNVNVHGKEFNIPTKLSEITHDYLKAVTRDVVVENNYAIVAYCIVGRLGVLCDTSNKNGRVGATFILVRANDPNMVIKSAEGDKLICAETDIMRGIEIVCPANVLQTNNVVSAILSCGKDEHGANIKNPLLDMRNGHYNDIIYTVNFKLVPLCDIHGSYRKLTDEETKALDSAVKVYCK